MTTPIQQRSPRLCLRRIRLGLLCFSVGANAICAGGIFCFPIISPALVALKLTQPQLTTIALAGMVGQYPLSAVVGKILDHYGAWTCSLISACLFSAGFGLFASEISEVPDTVTHPSISTFHHLVIFFLICGLGTIFSYFSSVFAASKTFPNYIGIATGISTGLFGLSPTFLSVLASRYFSSPDGEINVSHFLRFLAILCGSVHLLGGFAMRIIPPDSEQESNTVTVASDPETPNERTVLLPNKINGNDDEHDQVRANDISIADTSPKPKDSVLDLLLDRTFWALAFIVFVILGSCEMIMSNIGTILLSLPNRTTVIHIFGDAPSTTLLSAAQVRILSVANTLSRLLVGALADIASPMPSCAVNGGHGSLRKHRISRIVFVTFSAGVLVCTYAWMVVGVREQESVWTLSIGAGLAYGCMFTILPSLVSSVWGLPNLGRNYGITNYATLIGTPVFSYLYAFVTAAHVSDDPNQDGVCHGPACWRLTFGMSAFGAALAFGASMYLWRAWKGRV